MRNAIIGKGKFGFSESILLIAIIILAAAQFFIPSYYRFMLTLIFIYGIFALGFDLLLGYTGLLSFGHALFFGMSAFTFAFLIRFFNYSFWLSLLIGVIVGTGVAAGVGSVAIRTKGIYFAVLTFIFSYVAYYIALDPSIARAYTGGHDGFNFTPPPLGFGFFQIKYNPVALYYLAFAFLLITYLICRRIVNSPLGRAMMAVRENEERAKCLGYNTTIVKFAAFTFSGIFAALSGCLYAYLYHYVSTHYIELATSASVVIWTLFGGAGTLVGPLLGAGIITLFMDYIMTYVGEFHLIMLGILLIIVIMFLPRGIFSFIRGVGVKGGVQRRRGKISSKQRR